MATETTKAAEGAVLKQVSTGPRKAKQERSFVIEPRTLVIAGIFAIAVILVLIVGVRTFNGPAYPRSPQARSAEASQVANSAEQSIAARLGPKAARPTAAPVRK